MTRPSIATFALCLAGALGISTPLRICATEGSFFDNRGMQYGDSARWQGYTAQGDAAMDDRSYGRAIGFFTAALDQRPREDYAAYLHARRGDAYFRKGELEKARADYLRAISFQPRGADDYLIRANTFGKLGNYRAAASDLAKAVELAPEDSSALNSLAWLQATCPDASVRDGRSALRAGTKACELTKWKNSSIIDSLAAAHAEAGAFADAIKFEQQAIGMRSTTTDDRKEMQERLALYQRRKPYREAAGALRPVRRPSD